MPTFIISTISIYSTISIPRWLSPKFGAMVAEEAARRGYLRYIHSRYLRIDSITIYRYLVLSMYLARIITNSEEIAFYSGHKVELRHLDQAYTGVVQQSNKVTGTGIHGGE